MKKRLFKSLLYSFMAITLLQPHMAFAADEAVEEAVQEIDKDTSETEVPNGDIVLTAEPEPVTVYTDDDSSPDELFSGYVNSILYDTPEISPSTSSAEGKKLKAASPRLSGLNLTVYNLLAERIEAVAAGESESTVFELTLEELGLDSMAWTAEDLGVDAIVKDGKINPDASAAVWNGPACIDLSRINQALLSNMPYSLYWYDKTTGLSQKGFSVTASGYGDNYVMSLATGLTISFAVNEEYASGEYTVNSSIGSSVNDARANAESIVSNYASASDYSKLLAYKDEICNRVDYNHDAADNDSTPYGNPWQLIWVFDNDSSSNVVCEGYAKAFKYLCDLSTFTGDIDCMLVTGDMDGGTGAGGHMWNIVNMNDSQNYLVDVTNCDEGTIGYPDKLFLVGNADGSAASGYTFALSKNISFTYDSDTRALFSDDELTLSSSNYDPNAVHVHSWDAGVITKEATCIETGEITYTCSCGETRTEELPIDSANHTGRTEIRNASEPTYDSEGYTGDTYCADCDALLETGEIIPVLETQTPVDEITGVYVRNTPLEIIMERDFMNGSFIGSISDEPTAGDKVTFTFPDGSVKSYTYQKNSFVNDADAEDIIPKRNYFCNPIAHCDLWEPGGDHNYYEVEFWDYFEDTVICRVPIEVTSTPVASIEYYPFPRLRLAPDAALSATSLGGDKVVVHYKDGTDDTFLFDSDLFNYISENTGEPIPENGNNYYGISTSYDPETLTETASFMGVTASNNSSNYYAEGIRYEQSKPVVMLKGRDSETKIDANGNEYEEYAIYFYEQFNEDDRLIVTYRNGLDDIIDVEYVCYNQNSFILPEDSPYFTGLPSDGLYGNYFSFDLPDQSIDHLEVGQTYSMNLTFHEWGSNFDHPAFTTEGEPYSVTIAVAGDELIDMVYFEDNEEVILETGTTYQLELSYHPSYCEPTISWKSSNPAVATVDDQGLVTCLKEGFTEITAAVGQYKANRTITVYEEKELTDENVTIDETAVYTGSPIKGIKVYYDGSQLYKDYHYTAEFEDNTNIGEATVTITGLSEGHCYGTVTKTFRIVGDLSITATQVTVTPSVIGDCIYTGSPVEPVISEVSAIGRDGVVRKLTKGQDYHLEYGSNTNIGRGYVYICGDNDYTGRKALRFNIVAETIDISTASIISIPEQTYTGEALTPIPVVMLEDTILNPETDYDTEWENNVNAGTAAVIIRGKGKYTGEVSSTFTIKPKEITPAITLSATAYTYDGKVKTPAVTVKDGELVLEPEKSYTVTLPEGRKNTGTYSIAVELTGNYTGSGTATFKINKAAQTITAKAAASSVAVGKATTISVSGTKESPKLTYKSSDTGIATVSTAGKITAKKVGTVKITVTAAATSNYAARSATVTIKVVPAATASVTTANLAKGIKVTWKKVTGATGYYVYRNGKLLKKITNGSTLTYTDTAATTNGAKYIYKVTAYAATTGTSTLSKSVTTYQVARPAISSLTSPKTKQMLVKWGKNAKATGYQIQYSTSSTFASGNKTVTVKGAATVSRTISSLLAKKRYYVRIRTYMTVSSKNYYSAWSAVKNIVTK